MDGESRNATLQRAQSTDFFLELSSTVGPPLPRAPKISLSHMSLPDEFPVTCLPPPYTCTYYVQVITRAPTIGMRLRWYCGLTENDCSGAEPS